MAWFLRLDRFASAHMVRSQEKENSCGIASLLMVNFKMKKHIIAQGMATGAQVSQLPFIGGAVGLSIAKSAIDDAIRSEPEVYKIYDKYKGSKTDFDKNGSNPALYPAILSELGLGTWECVNVGRPNLVQAVIDATKDGVPVIVAVLWNGGGGHAIVIDETHSLAGTNYLCFCDPWDGELRLVEGTPGSQLNYDGDVKPFSFTLFGDRHEYKGAGNQGYCDGRIVRRVSV